MADCFEQDDIDEMISCRDEAHLFCSDCLKNFAKSQIFGSGNLGIDAKTKKPTTELKCIHRDGRTSGFDATSLGKALPKKTLDKYNELQFQAVVAQAGMKDLWYV